ncbi:MAG: hypothetical protein V3V08_17295 [Nannocystaceae bacterium]
MTPAQQLEEFNQGFARDHVKNRIFEVVGGGLLSDPARRDRFLDAVQVWSGSFQRAMLLRSATADAGPLADVFRAHLREEFDHDVDLASQRNQTRAKIWDPTLDSLGSWFLLKMMTADAIEKWLIVHRVLEVGSDLVRRLSTMNGARDTRGHGIGAETGAGGLGMRGDSPSLVYETGGVICGAGHHRGWRRCEGE